MKLINSPEIIHFPALFPDPDTHLLLVNRSTAAVAGLTLNLLRKWNISPVVLVDGHPTIVVNPKCRHIKAPSVQPSTLCILRRCRIPVMNAFGLKWNYSLTLTLFSFHYRYLFLHPHILSLLYVASHRVQGFHLSSSCWAAKLLKRTLGRAVHYTGVGRGGEEWG